MWSLLSVSCVSSTSLRTCSLHEGPVQSEGDQRLIQVPQEVFEQTTNHVDVLDFTEHQPSFTLKEPFSEFLHQTLPSRDPVQTSLHTHTHAHLQNPVESSDQVVDGQLLTSYRPLLSISVTHSMTS